jgi:hypothetical protein
MGAIMPRAWDLTIWCWEECNGCCSFTMEVNGRIIATVPVLVPPENGENIKACDWLVDAVRRYC